MLTWWNSVYAEADGRRAIARARPNQFTTNAPVASAANNRAISRTIVAATKNVHSRKDSPFLQENVRRDKSFHSRGFVALTSLDVVS